MASRLMTCYASVTTVMVLLDWLSTTVPDNTAQIYDVLFCAIYFLSLENTFHGASFSQRNIITVHQNKST